MPKGPQFEFIQAPPKAYMRRVKPRSAERLFEWLVDHGYAEPVTTIRSRKTRAPGKARRATPRRSRR